MPILHQKEKDTYDNEIIEYYDKIIEEHDNLIENREKDLLVLIVIIPMVVVC
jgi:hypothetical protein